MCVLGVLVSCKNGKFERQGFHMYVSSVLVRCKKESSKVRWGGVGRRRVPLPPSLKTRPAEAHGPKCVLPDAIIIWQNAVGPLRRPRVGWVGAWVGGVGHVFS